MGNWTGVGVGWGYQAVLLHLSSIEVRNEWSLTVTRSWHAQPLHIILCGISKAKTWWTLYQQLCFWMSWTNSAVRQQMSLRLGSYLKTHIFRLFRGPRNEISVLRSGSMEPNKHCPHPADQSTSSKLDFSSISYISPRNVLEQNITSNLIK